VQIEVDPQLDGALVAALEPFLLRALHRRKDVHPALASSWRRAAARESVENDPFSRSRRYALSPRSTRGATRA
jgi:hypothetical protein